MLSLHTHWLPVPGDILLKYVAAKRRMSYKKKERCLKTVMVDAETDISFTWK